ncbi:Integrin beta-1-binding protein 2 [Schaereria dolodes]|nr:Integrin beta-1-binding protein 2 [Schaereria dolodes]
MSEKCVHKGCGKSFTNPDEDCIYHPGPPIFHEGQKGWKCCKPRVLTFDEFLSIPPCTTGKHSTVDDTPVSELTSSDAKPEATIPPAPKPIVISNGTETFTRTPQSAQPPPPVATPEPESDSDAPELPVPPNTTCRRRACNVSSPATITSRNNEECIYHPGHPIFHEGSKGWTCCKRRVLEFDEFMRIEGCKRKGKHLFVGSGKKKGRGSEGAEEEKVESVRHDFYQTPSTVIASLYLKKINKQSAKIRFSSATTLDLDLPTTDSKRYKTIMPLFGPVDPEKSTWKIMGTKMELTLVKADGGSWPVLRADERRTGEIIQVGQAGRA